MTRRSLTQWFNCNFKSFWLFRNACRRDLAMWSVVKKKFFTRGGLLKAIPELIRVTLRTTPQHDATMYQGAWQSISRLCIDATRLCQSHLKENPLPSMSVRC